MDEPSRALWPTLQKMPMKGCHSVGHYTVTSLSGMPELRGNCPLSKPSSFRTTDVVLKPMAFGRCIEKGITLACLAVEKCASFHWRSLFCDPLSVFTGASFFIGGLFYPLSIFRGASFSSEVFF
jgi:hypothetical protein